MKVLIVRYSEIGVKSDVVRKKMEKALIHNLIEAAKAHSCGEVKVEKGQGRIYLHGNVECLKISSSKVFGVKSVSPSEMIEFSTINDIVNYAENLWKDRILGKTFAVRVRRVGEHQFTSIDVAREVGDKLHKYAKVNLDNPDVELHIEIRKNRAYFFEEIIEGPGGLPLGVEGKGLALVSGGIDSPVAAWMIMRRGVALDILHCNISGPMAFSAIKLVFEKLKQWSYGYTPKIYVIDCGKIIYSIMKEIDKKLWPVAFKRALYLIAVELAKKYDYKCIVTGEALGQVSSQTLHSLSALQHGIDILFLRPLIGFDKDSIVEMAKKIGTFNISTSIPEYCAIFSHKPKTKPTIKDIEVIDNVLTKLVKEVVEQQESKTDVENLFITNIPENSVIIDLRNETDYKRSHLPNAIRIDPKDVLDYVIRKGDKNATYVLYCYNGVMSGDIAYRLRQMGYKAYALAENK